MSNQRLNQRVFSKGKIKFLAKKTSEICPIDRWFSNVPSIMHSTCLKVRCRIEQEKKRHQSGTVRLLDCVVIESIVRAWNIKNIEELDLVQTSYVVLPLPCENSFPPEKSGFNFPPRRYRRTIFWCCSEDSIFFQSASHPSPFGKITRKTRCFFVFPPSEMSVSLYTEFHQEFNTD